MEATNRLTNMRLTDLELSDEVRGALERHFLLELMERMCEGTLDKIPDIDLPAAQDIAAAILAVAMGVSLKELDCLRGCSDETAETPSSELDPTDEPGFADEPQDDDIVEDPGMKRLLDYVGNYIRRSFFVPGEDFYTMTHEKRSLMLKIYRGLTQTDKDLVVMLYGLNGNEPVSKTECMSRFDCYPTVSKLNTALKAIMFKFYSHLTPQYAKSIYEDMKTCPIEYLGLQKSTLQRLKTAGFETIADLTAESKRSLKEKVKNFGDKGVDEVSSALWSCGCRLKKK